MGHVQTLTRPLYHIWKASFSLINNKCAYLLFIKLSDINNRNYGEVGDVL